LRYANISGQCVRKALKDTPSSDGKLSQKARAELRDTFAAKVFTYQNGQKGDKSKPPLAAATLRTQP
jgi:hypothetical protein